MPNHPTILPAANPGRHAKFGDLLKYGSVGRKHSFRVLRIGQG